jgi:peptidoglycan hydrolase-like protein with peptidoglycan-binding domain
VLPTGETSGPYCPNCGDLARDHTAAGSQTPYGAGVPAATQALAAVPADPWVSGSHAAGSYGDPGYGDVAYGESPTRAFTAPHPGYAQQSAQPAQPLAPPPTNVAEEYDAFFRPEPGQPIPPTMTRVMAPVAQPAAFGSEVPQQYGGYGPPSQPAYDQPIDYQAAPGPYPEPPYAEGYPDQYDAPGGLPPRSSRSAKIGIGAAAVAILVIIISLISLGGGKGTPAAAPGNAPTTDVTVQNQVPNTDLPATTDPSTAPSPSASHIPGALQFGDSGADVKWLQTRLHQINMYNGPISGKFDQATVTAVTAFQQRSHASDPPGVVGRSTKTALIAWGSRPKLTVAGAIGGDKHTKVNPDDVKRLQRALATALNQNIKATGTFDAPTFGAVMAYQSAVGLVPDGAVGDRVWAALQSGKLPGQ